MISASDKGGWLFLPYDCARFKRIPSKRKSSDEWLITPTTNDPIVNDELWHYVQKTA